MNVHPSQIGPSETHEMLNITYDIPAARCKREGYIKVYDNSLGDYSIDGMFTYDPRSGNPQELVWYNGKVYKEIDGALIEILSGLTKGRVSAVQLNDQLFFINGTDKKRYDGTNFFPWGVAAPTTGPSVAAGTSGQLTGTYYYKVIFEDSKGGKSNPSPASANINLSNQQCILTNIPIGATGTDVVKRHIYRTMANQTDYYYYLTTLNDNTTTTYTDNMADTSLGTRIETNNNVCPQGSFCITWNQRILVSGIANNPQQVYPSKIGRPEQFDTPLEIDASDGQAVTALEECGRYALIGKERGLYRLEGDVLLPSEVSSGLKLMKVTKLKSHVGPANWRVCKKIGAWVMFLSKYEGIWCLLTIEDTEGIPNVIYASEDIEPLIKRITNFDNAHAYVYDNKFILHADVLTDNNVTKRYEFICSFKLSNPYKGEFWWEVHELNDNIQCYHRRTDGYLYGGDDKGYIYKFGKTGDGIYSDNGASINAYFYLPDLDFSNFAADAGLRNKILRRLWVSAKRWESNAELNIIPRFNGMDAIPITISVTKTIDGMNDRTLGGNMAFETFDISLENQWDNFDPVFKHFGAKIGNNQLNEGMVVYKIGGEICFLPAF